MKLRIQAQHLQPSDIVGSGEVVRQITISSIHWPSNKVQLKFDSRISYWGKYTMINVERQYLPMILSAEGDV